MRDQSLQRSNLELLKLSDFYSNDHEDKINLILKKQTY